MDNIYEPLKNDPKLKMARICLFIDRNIPAHGENMYYRRISLFIVNVRTYELFFSVTSDVYLGSVLLGNV